MTAGAIVTSATMKNEITRWPATPTTFEPELCGCTSWTMPSAAKAAPATIAALPAAWSEMFLSFDIVVPFDELPALWGDRRVARALRHRPEAAARSSTGRSQSHPQGGHWRDF